MHYPHLILRNVIPPPYCHTERAKRVEVSHLLFSEKQMQKYLNMLCSVSLYYLVFSNHYQGEKEPFRTVPIPLLPPLPPNDSGIPQDPCGSGVENLLDFLLLVNLFYKILDNYFFISKTILCFIEMFRLVLAPST